MLYLKNRFLIIAFFVLIVLWGFYSVKNTPVDAIPDIGELQVIVYAEFNKQIDDMPDVRSTAFGKSLQTFINIVVTVLNVK